MPQPAKRPFPKDRVPPKHQKIRPVKKGVVFLGPSIRLVTDDWLLEQLEPFGLSRIGLSHLLRALHIPVLFVGRSRLIDLITIEVAFRNLLRLGKPDFIAPGATAKGLASCPPRRTVPAEELARDWEAVVAEVLMARRSRDGSYGGQTAKLARDAVSRMMALGLSSVPLKAEERLRVEAMEAAKSAGVIRGNSPFEPGCEPQGPAGSGADDARHRDAEDRLDVLDGGSGS